MSVSANRKVESTAVCWGCDVRDPDAFSQSTTEGRSYDAVRMAAQRHAAKTGHKVTLHTESVTTYGSANPTEANHD